MSTGSMQRIRYKSVIVLAIIGCALSFYAFIFLREMEQKRINADFDVRAKDFLFSIKYRMGDSINEVEAVESLYKASNSVERNEFAAFTLSLLQKHTGILALEWAPRVSRANRNEMEEIARKKGLVDFQITERNDKGQLVRAGERDEYFPGFYIEPLAGNEKDVGFDFASNPTCKAAFDACRKSGKIQATARITFIRSTERQNGFMLCSPIYIAGSQTDNPDNRWNNLKGYVLGVFQTSDILNIAMKDKNPGGIQIRLFDMDAPPEERFLGSYSNAGDYFATPVQEGSETISKDGSCQAADIIVGQRHWKVIFEATPEYLASGKTWLPWCILLIGVVLTTAIVGYLLTVIKSSEHSRLFAEKMERSAEELEQEITEREEVEKSLHEALNNTQGILEALPYGVVIVGMDKKIRQINNVALRMIGNPPANTIIDHVCHNAICPGEIDNCPILDKGYRVDNAERELIDIEGRHIPIIKNVAKITINGEQVLLETFVNISNIKQTELLLLESQERLRTITDSAKDAIIMMDPDGLISFWNPAAESIFGYTEHEALGQNAHELLAPEPYLEAHRKAFRRFIMTGQGNVIGKTVELTGLHKDGREIPIDISLSAILLQNQWHAVAIIRDITERIKTEQSLKLFRILADNSSDAIEVVDIETGNFLDINERGCLNLGFSREELLNMSVFDIDQKVTPEIFHGKMIELRKLGVMAWEGRHRRKDGSTFPVEVNMKYYRHDRDYLISVVRDITERKQTEEKIRRISDMQRIINLLMSYSLTDVSLEDISKYALDLLFSISWLSIEQIGAIFLADNRSQGLRMISCKNLDSRISESCSFVVFGKCLCGKAALTGQTQFAYHIDERHEISYRGMLPHGHYCVPIKSMDKNLGVLCLHIKDGHVHDQKEEEFLNMVADVLAGIIVRKSADARLKRLTEQFLSFGHDPVANIRVMTETAGELLSANFSVYLRISRDTSNITAQWMLPANFDINAAQAGSILHDIMHVGAGRPMFLRNLTGYAESDPNVKNCDLKAAVGHAGKVANDYVGGLFLGFSYNAKLGDDDLRILGIITSAIGIEEARIVAENERKYAEAMRQQAQKLESIGQLASGIAHEINNPMQYVGDNTRFLQKSFADLVDLLKTYAKTTARMNEKNSDPAISNELNRILQKVDVDFLGQEIPAAIQQSLEGIDRITRIIKAMRDMTHPDSTKKTLIDLNRIIESTLTVSRHEWKYVADVELHLDPDMPMVPCLAGDLSQAIINLIVNASHAIADIVGNGSNGRGKITITTGVSDGMARIVVKDTGSGILPEHQNRIFEPFFTTKPVGKGTGQGLAICRNVIVKKLGGKLDFETEVGKGTSFIIQLPLQ